MTALGGLTPGQQPTPFLFRQEAPPHVREFMCASGHPRTIQAVFTCLTNSLVLGMDSEKLLLKVALKDFWAPHSQPRPRNRAQNLVGTATAHMEISPGRRGRDCREGVVLKVLDQGLGLFFHCLRRAITT